MNPTLRSALKWLVAVIVPFLLLMTAIRLLFTPLYPQVVYRLPGFPPDYYGFSFEERLHWADYSIEYLLNDADITFLSSQQLSSGEPLYNQRELSHMLDVKIVFQQMVVAWRILLLVIALLAFWALRGGWAAEFRQGLSLGGKLTVGLVAFILLGVVVSFNWLFTVFHRLFFTGDSWIFLYTDTLIRLFPLPFWMIGFIAAGVITLGFAALLIRIKK